MTHLKTSCAATKERHC